MTAILNFFENQYTLQGLDILDALEGCYYKDLPPFLLRRLEERTIKCLRIDSTVDPQVKYDIFERLNSGSVALGSHELRNAVLRGPFNNLCKKLAKNEDFRILNQISISNPEANSKVKKMEDVELVLRFFALIEDNYKTYKKSKDKNFKDFLSENLEDKNKLDSVEIDNYSTIFIDTMKFIRTQFGDTAFAKYKDDNGKFTLQSKFNAAVYDALAVAVASEVIMNKNKGSIQKKIKEKFIDLFADLKFHDSVSGSILDSTKLIHRIDVTKNIFK